MAANKGSHGNDAYGGRSRTFKKSRTDVQDDDCDMHEGCKCCPVLWTQDNRSVHVAFRLFKNQQDQMVDSIMYDDVEQGGSILVLTVNGFEFWKYRLDKPVEGSLQLTRSSCGTKVHVTLTKSNYGEQWTTLGQPLFDGELSESEERSLAYREIKFLKDDFYNKGGSVSYIAYVEDLHKESVHVTFNPCSFSFIFSTTCQKFLKMYQEATPNTVFYRHVKTRHTYDHTASSFKTTARTIEITLVKQLNQMWSSVEAPAAAESVVPASTSTLASKWQPLKEPSASSTSAVPVLPTDRSASRQQHQTDGSWLLASDPDAPDDASGRSPNDGNRHRRQRSSGTSDLLTRGSMGDGDYSSNQAMRNPDLTESWPLPTMGVNDELGLEQPYAGDGSGGPRVTAAAAASSTFPTSPPQPGKPMCVVQPLKDEDVIGDSAKPSTSGATSSFLSPSTLYTGPFRGTRFTGLENLGNTCFMNAGLQVLASTVEFRDYFLNGRFEHDINRDNPLGTGGRLATAFAELMRCLWRGDRPSYAPSKLKSVVTAKAAQFTGYAQHDAQEFLAFLLDGLHEDLNKVKNKPYVPSADGDGKCDEELSKEAWDAHKRRNDSLVVDAFQAQYKSKLVCPMCAKVSITFDPYMYLSVPLPRKRVCVPVYLCRRQPTSKPVKYVLALPGECTADHVLRELAEKSGIPAANLRLFEAHKQRFLKFYDAGMQFSATVGTENHILFASEVLTRDSAGEHILELRVTQWTSVPTETAATRCASCHREPSKLRRCTGCYKVGYCNSDCQKKHWDVHRPLCRLRPELIGLPFIISIQESRATYQCIAQMMEEYAQYSVNLFQRLQSKQAAGSHPASVAHVTAASSKPVLSPPSDVPGCGGGRSPDADSLSTGDRSSSFGDVPRSPVSADASGLAGDPAVGVRGATQSADDGAVTFVIGDSAAPLTQDGCLLDDSVAGYLDSSAKGNENLTIGDTRSPAAALDSPAATLSPNTEQQLPLPRDDAWGLPAGSPIRHGGDYNAADAASGSRSPPASPCSPLPSMLSSTSELLLSTPPAGLLAPSPSSPQTSSRDTIEGSPPSPEADYATRHPPTSPRSKPTRPVVGVANTDAGACGSRRTFPFSIKLGTTDGRAMAKSAPLCDDGDWPLRFTSTHAFSGSGPIYLTMEWHNDDRSSDYVLLNSKDLDHELDASCTASLKDDLTLEQCLQLFTEPERLTPEDAWYCPNCKQHREATKQLSLWTLPDILIIHLKRFSFQNFMWQDKADKLVEYPIRGLDLSQYCVGPCRSQPQLYDLFGVVNHYGILIAGHYTAYARCVEDGSRAAPYGSEQGWRLFDDSSVTHAAEKSVVSPAAYILFYRKRQPSVAAHSTSVPAPIVPDSQGFGDGVRRRETGSGSTPLSSGESEDDDDSVRGWVTAAAATGLANSPSSSRHTGASGDDGSRPGNTDMNSLD